MRQLNDLIDWFIDDIPTICQSIGVWCRYLIHSTMNIYEIEIICFFLRIVESQSFTMEIGIYQQPLSHLWKIAVWRQIRMVVWRWSIAIGLIETISLAFVQFFLCSVYACVICLVPKYILPIRKVTDYELAHCQIVCNMNECCVVKYWYTIIKLR